MLVAKTEEGIYNVTERDHEKTEVSRYWSTKIAI
jgi:hypothetical protein